MDQSDEGLVSEGLRVPDRVALSAFVLLVVIGGGNMVAISISNLDLPPFWGAFIRLATSGLIFWLIVRIRRIKVPVGRALSGAILYGFFSVGASYAFVYWGLLDAPPGLAMVIMALVPLMTYFFALLHRIETFHWRGLVGALIALTGILLAVGSEIGTSITLVSVLALIAGGASVAESFVVYKLFPHGHPVATNAIAMTTGATFLFILSMVAGEAWILPNESATWMSYFFLVFIGTVLYFYLYLVILNRWTASATSYAFLLFPISTTLIASVLTVGIVTSLFVIGSVLVVVGVWIGAISKSESRKVEESRTPTL